MVRQKKSSFKGKTRKDADKQSSSGNDFGYLKVPKGVSMYSPTPKETEEFDVIPYRVTDEKHPDHDKQDDIALVGDLWYKRPFWVHRNIGTDGDTELCLKSFSEKCPICEYKKKQLKDGVDYEEVKGYNASKRNLYCVIPIGVKEHDEEIHVFDMSDYNFQELLNAELQEKEEHEVFPDLEEGLTLEVRWNMGKFKGNKYAEAGRIDFNERSEAYDESILDDVPNLDNCFKKLSYQELYDKFFELEDEDSARESTKETKKEDSKKKPIRKKKDKKEEKSNKLTGEELKDMDVTELIDVIDAKKIDIDPDDYENVEDLCKAVAEELEIEIDEEPKKKEDSKQAKRDQRKREKEEAAKDNENETDCPHGHTFGKDCDKFKKDCEDCKLWDDCFDNSEG